MVSLKLRGFTGAISNSGVDGRLQYREWDGVVVEVMDGIELQEMQDSVAG